MPDRYVDDSDDDAAPPPVPVVMPPPAAAPAGPPVDMIEAYKKVARAGAQLGECAAASRYAATRAVVAGFEKGTLRLDRPLVGVLDGVLDAATCRAYAAAARARFAARPDARLALQGDVRGDDVEFVDLSDGTFLGEAKAALAGVAAAVAAAAAPVAARPGVRPPGPLAVLVVDRATGAAKRASLTAKWRRRRVSDLAGIHGRDAAAVDALAADGALLAPGAVLEAVLNDGDAVVLAPRGRLLGAAPRDLLVPAAAQLALYDGERRSRPRYVPHRDNDATIMGDGENHRELTAILYFEARPAGAAGGALRCHVGAAPGDAAGATATGVVDVEPKPGRLVLFRSRDLLHEVLPVVGWRRAALSVWVLRDARPAGFRT